MSGDELAIESTSDAFSSSRFLCVVALTGFSIGVSALSLQTQSVHVRRCTEQKLFPQIVHCWTVWSERHFAQSSRPSLAAPSNSSRSDFRDAAFAASRFDLHFPHSTGTPGDAPTPFDSRRHRT